MTRRKGSPRDRIAPSLALMMERQFAPRRKIVNKITQPKYILGHSPAEVRRLMLQATILRPITERLLRSAKLGPGMRVLDLGCGAGDVSMLAAEFVGPSGAIVGIDRSPEVVASASARAGGRATTGRLYGRSPGQLFRPCSVRLRDWPIRLGPSGRSRRFHPRSGTFRPAGRHDCVP